MVMQYFNNLVRTIITSLMFCLVLLSFGNADARTLKWQAGTTVKIFGSCDDGDTNTKRETNACIVIYAPGEATHGNTVCCDEWERVEICSDGEWHLKGIQNAEGCDGDLGSLGK